MAVLYVMGGHQRKNAQDRDEWHAYQKAVILQVDTRTREVNTAVEYISPPHLCAARDPSIVFKAGHLDGDRLLVCTQTEVLGFDVHTWKQTLHLSLESFNDVHHVMALPSGGFLVANTGLDRVEELSAAGERVRMWNVLGEEPWARFSPNTDYRKVETTKPHLAHPNAVFVLGDDFWATRFEQKDAVCLTRAGLKMDIQVGKPHDGVISRGKVHFTTVNGHLVTHDASMLQQTGVLDLNQRDNRSSSLGWCRGLCLVDGRFWVGFSRFRPTRFRENLSWIKHGFEKVGNYKTLPTRIACYDPIQPGLVDEFDLEPHGLNAIFGILSGAAHG